MSYYLFRFLKFVCPLLPSRFGYWLFARLGDAVYAFSAKQNSVYFQNLQRVLGVDASPERVRATARRGYQNLLKNYFDLFRAHGINKEKLKKQLASVQGFEHLEGAMKQGKGVIAGSCHFGAWDMVIHLTGIYLDTKVLVPQEHLKPEKMFQLVMSMRREQGIDVVAVENSPREILRALKAGRIVGLAFDRDITESGQIVNFFGAPARLPDGAVQLALKFNAPVVIGFAIRERDNRARVVIEPPLTFERTGDHQRDLCAGVEKIAAILQKYFRENPEQWLMFQQVWLDA
jgi:KDO2-lipid IV(A) lauroyltransferase